MTAPTIKLHPCALESNKNDEVEQRLEKKWTMLLVLIFLIVTLKKWLLTLKT